MDSRTDFDAALAAEPPIPDPNAASPGPRTVEPAADEDPAAGSPFVAQWLGALFGHVDGDVTAIADGKRIVVSSAADIVSLAHGGDVRVDLETSHGFAGFAMGFDSATSAQAAWGKTLEPSRVVKTPDGGIVAIYLTDAPAAVIHQILDEWQPADDEPGSFLGTGTVVPLPVGAHSTTTADEEDVAEGNTTVYSEAEIRAAFLSEECVQTSDAEAEPHDAEKFNDAVVIQLADPPDGFLTTPITIGYTDYGKDTAKWRNVSLTLIQFIDKITIHKEGPKEGDSFIQGKIQGTRRTKNAILDARIIVLDVDCGKPMAEVVETAKRLGFMTFFYTTHSHMATRTKISRTQYANWVKKKSLEEEEDNESNLKRYLVEVRNYVSSIADTVKYVGPEHTPEGVMIVVEHAPVEKYRVVLPLAEPFVVMNEGVDPHGLWKRKITGLGALLNVPIDRACTDLSRLFYFPRHDKGKPFAAVAVLSSPIRVADIPEKDDKAPSDDFAKAAAAMGARAEGPLALPGGTRLISWAADRAQDFQIAAVFEEYAPDEVRDRKSDDKYEITCPFDGAHGTAGSAKDRACMVVNGASNDSRDGGFRFACQHNSCAKKDRLEMLCEAITSGMIPEEALFESRFFVLERAEEAAAEDGEEDGPSDTESARDKGKPDHLLFADLMKAVEGFDAATKPQQRRTLWLRACRGNLPDPEIDRLVAAVVKKIPDVGKRSLQAEVKAAKAQVAEERVRKKSGKKTWPPEGTTSRDGFFWQKPDKGPERKVCAEFHPTMSVRTPGVGNWAEEIAFKDSDGLAMTVIVPRDALQGDGRELRSRLVKKGLWISPAEGYAMNALLGELPFATQKRAILAPQAGWYDGGYVSPTGESFSLNPDEAIRLENPPLTGQQKAGERAKEIEAKRFAMTLEDSYKIGVLFGYAGMLSSYSQIDISPAAELYGASTTGKTTSAMLGASALSNPLKDRGLLLSMDGTTNALEKIAALLNAAFFGLDEAAVSSLRDMEQLLFKLVQGSVKLRLNRSAELRDGLRWVFSLIITSETPAKETIRQEKPNRRVRGGFDVRIIQIDTTSNRILNSEEIAIVDLIKENFGHTGIEFAEYLLRQETHESIKSRITAATSALAIGKKPYQRRVATIFGIMQVTAEILESMGILPSVDGRAMAQEMFDRYLSGGSAPSEDPMSHHLDAIQEALVTRRNVDVIALDAANDDGGPRYREAVAFYDDDYFYVPCSSIVSLAGGGTSPHAIAKTMNSRGWLVASSGKNLIHRTLRTLSGKVLHYRIKRDAIENEATATGFDADDADGNEEATNVAPLRARTA